MGFHLLCHQLCLTTRCIIILEHPLFVAANKFSALASILTSNTAAAYSVAFIILSQLHNLPKPSCLLVGKHTMTIENFVGFLWHVIIPCVILYGKSTFTTEKLCYRKKTYPMVKPTMYNFLFPKESWHVFAFCWSWVSFKLCTFSSYFSQKCSHGWRITFCPNAFVEFFTEITASAAKVSYS